MLLLDFARDTIGLPMRGLHVGRNIGWTTDAGKAEAMRMAGAQVIAVRSAMIGSLPPGDDPARIIGYDVTFPVGTEKREAIAA